MYFCVTENFAYGKINERSFSNPHPRLGLGYVSYVNLVSAVVMSTYIIIFIIGHSIEYGIGKFIFLLNLNFDIM